MEDGWKFPLGYTSKLNFPHGTPIAYTDSMPIVAAAMKLFSRHLPSTFQYLGLVGFANYILQAFFGYKIGFALFKDRLLAAFASAFFTLAPPFVLRTGYHFSLSSQWLILASLWLYIRFDRQEERASETATVFWFCILFFFAGGITPYLAVLCLFVWLATGLLAFAKNRRSWLPRDLPLACTRSGAPCFLDTLRLPQAGHDGRIRRAGLSIPFAESFGADRSTEIPFALFQRSGRPSRPDRGIQLSRSRHYFSDRCLTHFLAVVPLPLEDLFLFGRFGWSPLCRLLSRHRRKSLLVPTSCSIFRCRIPWSVCFPHSAPPAGSSGWATISFCAALWPRPHRSFPEIAWSSCSRALLLVQILDCKSLYAEVREMLNSKPAIGRSAEGSVLEADRKSL